jgi:hypothetical protein
MAGSDRVDAWFTSWVVGHLERIPRDNWPAIGSEYWETVKAVFVRHGVQEVVATQASRMLAEAPPAYLDRHIEALLKRIREVWASSEVVADAPDERDAAKRASRDCDDCGGEGLTARYRKLSAGKAGADGRPLADRLIFYCRCPMGRWIERTHRTGNAEAKDSHKRIPDLAAHPWLWGWEYRFPPCTPESAIPREARYFPEDDRPF